MCFIEKKNCIRIRKRKDCVPDPVLPPSRVLGRGPLTGKVRVCVDFRDLNKANPKDDFPLPHIDM